jgi:hypothetical protein
MNMIRPFLALAVASPLLLGPDALAQTASTQAAGEKPVPRAILYRDTNFRGPSTVVTGMETNLRLGWQVRSIRVEGGSWELCQRADFRGGCTRYDESDTSIRSAVQYTQSVRPAPAAATARGHTGLI